MNDLEMKKFVHELNNCLNTANINSALLRRLYVDVIDTEVLDRLDAALLQAEKLSLELQSHSQSRSAAVSKS